MDKQLIEILEEKIDRAVKKIEALNQENTALRAKIQEQEEVLHNAQIRLDTLEEEKELIRGKVDGILRKINRVLDES